MRSRIAELDGLRAIAVLTVFGSHTYPKVFAGGIVGVDIFFVLSGYLITSIMYTEMRDRGSISIRAFYLRRVARLVPALTLMLIAYTVATYLLLDDKHDHYMSVLYSFYVMNFAQLYVHQPGYLGHTWTLAIEEQFYLVWPPLLLYLLNHWGRKGALAATIGIAILVVGWRTFLLASGAAPQRIAYGSDTHADVILIGCIWALAAPSASLTRVLSKTWILPTLVLAACIHWSPDVEGNWGYIALSVIALSSLWIIVALTSACHTGLGWILRLKPFVFLGSISYGFYLWHGPLLHILKDYFSMWSVNVAVTFCLTILIAWLSYVLLERPVLAATRRFANSNVRGLADRLLSGN